ncbi:MAG: DUF433 domain-containing protein [Chloroflexales bacterium]
MTQNPSILIVKSSEILSGTPVFAGTRVPVKNLLDYVRAGETITDFLDDFPSVSRTQVDTVLGRLEALVLEMNDARPA